MRFLASAPFAPCDCKRVCTQRSGLPHAPSCSAARMTPPVAPGTRSYPMGIYVGLAPWTPPWTPQPSTALTQSVLHGGSNGWGKAGGIQKVGFRVLHWPHFSATWGVGRPSEQKCLVPLLLAVPAAKQTHALLLFLAAPRGSPPTAAMSRDIPPRLRFLQHSTIPWLGAAAALRLLPRACLFPPLPGGFAAS